MPTGPRVTRRGQSAARSRYWSRGKSAVVGHDLDADMVRAGLEVVADSGGHVAALPTG